MFWLRVDGRVISYGYYMKTEQELAQECLQCKYCSGLKEHIHKCLKDDTRREDQKTQKAPISSNQVV